jgi:tagaturonate reductase
MMKLSQAWLKQHRPAELAQVSQLPERVLQIGEGNFLRGFADWLIHQLNQHHLFQGRVVVVAPRRSGARNIARLNAQDGLYTVWLRGLQDEQVVDRAEVVSSISRGIDPYAEWDQFLACAERQEIDTLISNTTESGIVYVQETYRPGRPLESFPGKLTAYLYHRFTHFGGRPDAGLTIIPCELVDDNGDRLRELVLRHAEEWRLPAEFYEWVNTANRFCNTLVDRIVSGFPEAEEAERMFRELGYEDELLTVGEPFHLWAISGDERLCERWPFDQLGLGVRYVDDVTPYRLQKVRILNGSHTAMSALALMAGLETVGEVMADDAFAAFVRGLAHEEIVPTLVSDVLSEGQLHAYADSVIERFANPYIRHELTSITLNSLSKIRVRLLPTLEAYAQCRGQLPRRLTLALAALLIYYHEAKWSGRWAIQDDAEKVRPLLAVFAEEPQLGLTATIQRILALESVWGRDLNAIAGLADAISQGVATIRQQGARAAVEQTLS